MSTFRYYENFLGTTAGKILTIINSNVNAPLKLPALDASNVTNIFRKFVTNYVIVSSSTIEISNRSTFILGSNTSTNANFKINLDMKKIFNAWQDNDCSYIRVAILTRYLNNFGYTFTINQESPFSITGFSTIATNNSFVESGGGISSNRRYNIATSSTLYNDEIYNDFLIIKNSKKMIVNNNNVPYCFSLAKTQALFNLKEFPDFSNVRNSDSFVWNSTNQSFIGEPMNELLSYHNFIKINDNYTLNSTDVPPYRKIFCIIVDANISNKTIDLGDPANFPNLKLYISCRTSDSNISVIGNSKIIIDSVLNPVISLGGNTQSNLRRVFLSNGSFWYCIGK